jgi:beta-galactosidase
MALAASAGSATRFLRAPSQLLIAVIAMLNLRSAVATDPVPRETVLFNAGWLFQFGDPDGPHESLDYGHLRSWLLPSGDAYLSANAGHHRPDGNPGQDVPYTENEFDDRTWRPVDLPHDWAIEGPFVQDFPGATGKLRYWGPAWYRKHFLLEPGDEGRRILLQIDGAMSYAAVWLNGGFVGGWPYGYSSFQLDLTPFVRIGADNVLAIRLNTPTDASRWYPGAGLYRNVWLLKTSPIHVAPWGVQITTFDAATAQVKVTVQNDSAATQTFEVRTRLFAPDVPNPHAVAESEPVQVTVEAGRRATGEMSLDVPYPQLWSTQHPQLYRAVITLEQGHQILDLETTSFGFRVAQFDPEKGFLLNGKAIKLNGVCLHGDLGALGIALNVSALRRRLELLREMGCNAIRTAHNPPAPELLDLADQMGLLVLDEVFDCWDRGKTSGDYHLLFGDWHEQDLRAWVRRDRNHPSVVLWSIGNEIPDQSDSTSGPRLAAELARIVHEEDPTRPFTSACDKIQAGYDGFGQALDVLGYNYHPTEYAKFHAAKPKQPVFGSETASCVSSRGEYFFPVSDDQSRGQADFQVSSYDLYAPPWATVPDAEFTALDQNPFVFGEFVWTGFDYLGEPTPYNQDAKERLTFTAPGVAAAKQKELIETGKIAVPSRSSYFGILDLAGFRKDRFYLYQARWRPDYPMAHILPHWTWPERIGQVTPVQVYTSGDEAELFLNGRSLGRKRKGPYTYRLRWDDVAYQPGELHAVAYQHGKYWAESRVRTAGPVARVSLLPERDSIAPTGSDLVYVTLALRDRTDEPVPRARNQVHFAVSGPGEIVATDNGDPTDHTPFWFRDRNAFNGLCQVIVRARASSRPGQTVAVTACVAGLPPARAEIRTANPPP